jgi:hypothetical protein
VSEGRGLRSKQRLRHASCSGRSLRRRLVRGQAARAGGGCCSRREPESVSRRLHRAAECALELEQLDEAKAHHDEALETTRAAGAGHSLTWVLVTAGTVSLMRVDAPQYAEAVERAAELGLTGSASTLRALHGLAWPRK